MNDTTMADAKREAERFLARIAELTVCRKPLTEAERSQQWGRRRSQHSDGCPETAAIKRASMELTRSLARLRRS